MGWRRWWSVVHGGRVEEALQEVGKAHETMTGEMAGVLRVTAMGMMDKVVRRLEHGRVVSAWGSWVWYVDEGNRREGLLRRCMSQLVRAHEGRGWRRWVWCTEESRRREEYATLSGMSERERAALEGRLRLSLIHI